jgi:DNA primase
VPLSRQILALAGEDLDLATAEGRARFLANGRPLWSALPDGMLKRQLLGEFASRGALPVDELAAAWRAARPGGPAGASSVRSGPTSRPALPRRGARPPMRQPADRIAWMLLLESGWWETLSGADHAALCALPGWHGELFRFLDRQSTEHGAQPWAALRERLADEPWAATALALVDAEDPAIEPRAEDLPLSLEQLRAAPERHDAMRVLGRI